MDAQKTPLPRPSPSRLARSTPPECVRTPSQASPTRSSPGTAVELPTVHGSVTAMAVEGNFIEDKLICSPQKSVNSPAVPEEAQTPMELLLNGEEQMVEIPLKTILIKVLEALPCKKKPRFDCKKLAPAAFQGVVEFDVTWTKYSVDPDVKVARILGDISSSPSVALTSAVKRAFEYLANNRFITVEDYSSKIMDGYANNGVGLALNSTLYLLEDAVGKWSFALDAISKFHGELERKEATARAALHTTKAPLIYGEAKTFLSSFLTKFTHKHQVSSRELTLCQTERKGYAKESDKKYSELIRKGLKETVRFTEKNVLEYVLGYLGLGGAEYSNEPVEGYMFIGEVKIWLPEIEEARCGGRTTFHSGHLLSASSAEQDAACKALRFLETRLKVAIGDMNFMERVEEKKRYISTVDLLHKISGVAETVKKQWDLMASTMKCGLDIYGGEVNEFSYAPMLDDEVEAVNFCASGMLSAHAKFTEQFKAASQKIEAIESYVDNLSDAEEY